MASLEIVVVAVLILLNGYLAMCELALRSQLERRAGGGDSGARAALILANDPARFLASLQIGITSVAVLTGTFSGATLAHRLDDWLDLFPAISPVVSVTFLSLLFGELVPKQIALKNPEALAIRLARPLVAFTQIAAPLVWALNASANLVLRIFGIRAGFERQPYRRGHRRRFNRGGKVGTYSRGGA